MKGIKHLALPKRSDKYLLTPKAAKLIEQACYLHFNCQINDGQPVEGECWLQFGVSYKTTYPSMVHYQMPVNLDATSFKHRKGNWHASYWKVLGDNDFELHPIQALIKKATSLEFIPEVDVDRDELKKRGIYLDRIYWRLEFPKFGVQDFFFYGIRIGPNRVIKKKNTKLKNK